MKSIRDLVEEHEFFRGLEPPYLELIAGCGRNVHFRPGERIFGEGEPADTFYVIREGKVAIEVNAPQRGPILIETLGAGEVLGWSWLFPPYRWSFDSRSLDETRAVALDGACLRGKCEDDSHLGYELMGRFARIMQERLQATRLQLLDVYGRDDRA